MCEARAREAVGDGVYEVIGLTLRWLQKESPMSATTHPEAIRGGGRRLWVEAALADALLGLRWKGVRLLRSLLTCPASDAAVRRVRGTRGGTPSREGCNRSERFGRSESERPERAWTRHGLSARRRWTRWERLRVAG